MRRINQREKQIAKLASINPWYRYEHNKSHLSPPIEEAEIKRIVQGMKI